MQKLHTYIQSNAPSMTIMIIKTALRAIGWFYCLHSEQIEKTMDSTYSKTVLIISDFESPIDPKDVRRVIGRGDVPVIFVSANPSHQQDKTITEQIQNYVTAQL